MVLAADRCGFRPLLCWIEVVYIEPARHAERRRQVTIVYHRHGLEALRLQDFREGRQVLNRRLRIWNTSPLSNLTVRPP